uniref:tRNA (guanine(46)-N(7))-methyltransferase n=1 Tax=Myxobolus squamalis TaxID=59785 RepID=A0A6B2G4U6_MYXSQ
MCSKEEQLSMPRKRDFRQRAHNNPLTDNTFNHPESSDHLSLSEIYPKFLLINEKVEFLDIGCGYGGLLFNISEKYSQKLMMGMEIRSKVHEYTVQKVKSLQSAGTHKNISFVRTNAMKYLPFYFKKGQVLTKYINKVIKNICFIS